MQKRSFLFLQGVASPFFNQLAIALKKQHTIYRINFCGGDCLYWSFKENTWNFTAPLSELEDFLKQKHQQFHFSDIVLFGDTRPIHVPAIAMAKKHGAKIWVFEEGYLRPNWLTLECNGVNGHSLLAKDADYYWQEGQQTPNYLDALETGYSQRTRFWHDVKYNAARYFFWFKFHHYKLHRPQSPLVEYLGWGKRLPLQLLFGAPHAKKITAKLIKNKTAFYLFPLQIHYDSQIKNHSPFDTIQQAIRTTLKSFAKKAPKDALIVLKNHPLDIGKINYPRYIKSVAKEFNISERTLFIDGGHLPTLLHHCQGTVTINSTVGISALFHRSPVIALGEAIYNIQGLTFQGELDDFWTQATPANRKLFQYFKNIVTHHTQINGNFYTPKGIQMTVDHAINRILSIKK